MSTSLRSTGQTRESVTQVQNKAQDAAATELFQRIYGVSSAPLPPNAPLLRNAAYAQQRQPAA